MAAATATTEASNAPDHTRNKRTPEEAYLRGKRNAKNPSEPAKLYKCGKSAHVSRLCPKSKKQPAKEKGQATEKTITAVAEAAAIEGTKGVVSATANDQDWRFGESTPNQVK